MNSIIIKIPESLHISAFDVSMFLATKFFEEGKLSSGQAAEMTGLSKRAFIEILGVYGVSVFGYGFEEIDNELKYA